MVMRPPTASGNAEQEAIAISRNHSHEALKVMARIANGSGKYKKRARQTLEKSLMRLKEIIDDPASPADLKQAALETRKKAVSIDKASYPPRHQAPGQPVLSVLWMEHPKNSGRR